MAHAPVSADEALQCLIEGNDRFRTGQSTSLHVSKEDLADLTRGQQPFATILGCSDSRVPPELIFDSGLGELFVVRVAGNVLSPEVSGSIQYAGSHLRTPLFVVLGHEGCGAVQAALETMLHGVEHRSHIQLLIDEIIPGLSAVDPKLEVTLQLGPAVEANVRATVRRIAESPEGSAALARGDVKLVGAVYEIGSGRVRFL